MKKKSFLFLSLFLLSLLLPVFSNVEASASDTIFCPQCGKQIYSNSKFCMYCGASIPSIDNSGILTAPTSSDVGKGNINVGDTVFFGEYEQDNNLSNGKEPIMWQVLDVQDGKALLLSSFAIDYQQYNVSTDVQITWRNCMLREWLNETFLQDAFSSHQQGEIIISTVPADGYPDYDYNNNSGKATKDKIFLLSEKELEQYLPEFDKRRCDSTDFCLARGLTRSRWYDGYCDWWLRSSGYIYNTSQMVNGYGSIENIVVYHSFGIRPALWVDLNS